MRDILLATGLLGTCAGLATGSAQAVRSWSIPLALAAVAAASRLAQGEASDRILVPVWCAAALGAASCWLPAQWRPSLLITALAVVSGGIAGQALSGQPCLSVLVFVAALLSSAFAATLLARRRWLLPVRVAAGWLVAIAMLNLSLTMLPVTPGYLPDHLE